MTGAELALAWLVGIGAAVGALAAILSGIPKLWKFARKFASTVDVVAELPSTLAAMDKRLLEHVVIAEQQRAEINTALETRSDAIDVKFRELTAIVLDVRHEVKNNGGSSLKDGVDQLRADLAGLYAQPGEPSAPGRTAPVPTIPPAKRTRRTKPETPR